MWKGLANLFEGHPNKYLTTSLTGEVDEKVREKQSAPRFTNL